METEQNKNLFKNATTCSESNATLTGGALPRWLQGNVLYNGPCGIYDFKNMSAKHWFDGMSILSSFKIQDRNVTFIKRFLKSNSYNEAIEQGRIARTEFGTAGSPAEKEKSNNSRDFTGCRSQSSNSLNVVDDPTDNCACSFYEYGNLTLATTETGFERVIDPDTLETGDLINMSTLANIKTARPLRDHNGDIYNLATSMIAGVKYHFLRFPKPIFETIYNKENYPAASEVEFVATIPTRWPNYSAYNHSFGMTDNYLIMCEQPWASNLAKMPCGTMNMNNSFRDSLEWKPMERNQFYIVNKQTGQTTEIKYLAATPFYFLNFINCYECGSHIVVDMIVYDSPELINQMQLDRLRNNSFNLQDKSKAYRFVIPLDFKGENIDLNYGKWKGSTAYRSGDIVTLHPQKISEHSGLEHPKVNPNFKYRKYEFFYGVPWIQGLSKDNFYSHTVSKIDTKTGEAIVWKGSEFAHPSEIVFVPNPSGTAEDDGIIISCVSDSRSEEKDFIVFLDARDMVEIARASFDQKIPFGSHTYYLHQKTRQFVM